MFQAASGNGRVDLFSAVVEPQGRGLTYADLARGLDRRELHELREIVAGTLAAALRPSSLAETRKLLVRGVLAARLAGAGESRAMAQARDLTGDLDIPEIFDVYGCSSCDRPLDTDAQLGLASGRPAPRPLQCAHCQGHPVALATPPWLARAELMLRAAEPLKALRLAAAAERQDAARPVDLARVRGWAAIALGNPAQAVRHLGRAVELEPMDVTTRWMLLSARAEAGEVEAVLAEAALLQRAQAGTGRRSVALPSAPGALSRSCAQEAMLAAC
jgi:hypothetical protein